MVYWTLRYVKSSVIMQSYSRRSKKAKNPLTRLAGMIFMKRQKLKKISLCGLTLSSEAQIWKHRVVVIKLVLRI